MVVTTGHIELLFINAVEKHLSFSVGVGHILCDCSNRPVIILKSLIWPTATAFLVGNDIRVTDKLAHDTLLFTEVARAAEHICTVARTAEVLRAVERRDAGIACAVSYRSSLLICAREVVVFHIRRLVVSQLCNLVLCSVHLLTLGEPSICGLV